MASATTTAAAVTAADVFQVPFKYTKKSPHSCAAVAVVHFPHISAVNAGAKYLCALRLAGQPWHKTLQNNDVGKD